MSPCDSISLCSSSFVSEGNGVVYYFVEVPLIQSVLCDAQQSLMMTAPGGIQSLIMLTKVSTVWL